jgi:hypothetical protein
MSRVMDKFRSARTLMATLSLLVIVVTGVGCAGPDQSPPVLPGTGIVTGGIDWCSGIGAPGPKYIPGRVNVYKGWPNTRSSRAYGAWLSSAHPVMRTEVKTNQTYRFALHPGRYTLLSIVGRARNTSFRTITIRQGVILHADISTSCL